MSDCGPCGGRRRVRNPGPEAHAEVPTVKGEGSPPRFDTHGVVIPLEPVANPDRVQVRDDVWDQGSPAPDGW